MTEEPLDTAYSLIFESWKKRAYISYPISEAITNPGTWAKVQRFRRSVRSRVTTFDPLMITEKRLQGMSEADTGTSIICALREGQIDLSQDEVREILPDIDGQIEARDYRLINQAEMIIAYYPADEKGKPLIAGGVQSEIEHAHHTTKEIVIVWEASKHPTPFIELKVDQQFGTLEELDDFLSKVSTPTGQLHMPFSPGA